MRTYAKKLPTKVGGGARPKALAQSLSLFPRVEKPSYKKNALQGDPAKFGNVGFDLNMLTPNIRGKRGGVK